MWAPTFLVFLFSIVNGVLIYEANILAMKGDRPVLGGKIRRRCTASPPNLRWRYIWRHPSGTNSTGDILAIYNLRAEDFGTYTCIAEAGSNRLVAHDTVGSNGYSLTQGNGQIARTGRPQSFVDGGRPSQDGVGNVNANSRTADNIVGNPQRPANVVGSDRRTGSRLTGSIRRTGLSLGGSGRAANQYIQLRIRPEAGENLVMGGTVRRRCSVSHPGFSIVWIYPNGRRTYDEVLRLNNIGLRDQGHYVCLATGPRGRTLNGTFTLGFEQTGTSQGEENTQTRTEVARIRIVSLPGENFVFGGNVRRECRVSSPGYTYQWQFPDNQIVDSSYLWLNNLSERHAGTYWCIATKNGARLRLSFRIAFQTEEATEQLQIVSGNGEQLVLGGTVRRLCTPPGSGWTVVWIYPNGRRVPGNLLALDNIGVQNEGRYVCVATRGRSRVNATFTLGLRERSGQGNRNTDTTRTEVARIRIVSLPGENFVFGGNVRRECRVSSPGYTYQWQFPDNQIVDSSYLWLNNLSERHAGTYWCIATKNGARLRLSFRIAFQTENSQSERGARLEIVTLDSGRVEVGGSLRKECRAREPGWRVYWRKPNGRNLPYSILFIDRLGPEHAGTYTCVAEKDGRSEQRSFQLQIGNTRPTSTARISIRTLPNENFVYGGTVRRECVVSEPGWQLQWRYPIGRTVNGRFLSLNDLKESDSGTYWCIASKGNKNLRILFRIAFTSDQRGRRFTGVKTVEITIRPRVGENLSLGGRVIRRCEASNSTWQAKWFDSNRNFIADRDLLLSRVRASQLGSYKCVARSRDGNEEITSQIVIGNPRANQLEVQSLTIEKLPSERLRIGGIVQRRCIAPGPGWNLFWELPSGSTQPGDTVRIVNLSPSDAGTYMCVAEKPGQHLLKSTFRVILLSEASPQYTTLRIKTLAGENLVIGGSVRKKCSVNAPNWDLHWMKASGQRVDGQYLNMDNLRPTDSGRYECVGIERGTNRRLVAWFSFRLEEQLASAEIDVENMSGETLIPGGSLRRRCVVNRPGYEIYWTTPNGTRIDSTTLIVSPLSERSSGRYICHARHRRTGATMSSWFSVNIQATRSRATLRINELPGESLVIGGRVRRECVASTPGWQLVWQLPKGQTRNGARLEINDLKESDGGRYVCRAVNSATGATMESWFSFRIVQVATIQMDTMPDERLQLGGVLSQRCRMSVPGWRIRWELPNGSLVLSDHLRITNLSRRHYGRYWCVATNPNTGETRRAWYRLS